MDRRVVRALATSAVALVVATLLDQWAYGHVRLTGVLDEDLGRLLRIMGFIGTWFALALAVGLHDAGAEPPLGRPRRRAWLLFLAPGLAGLAAEVMKIVVRRERPALNDGAFGFRPWGERTWSGGGLAFPSSHAAVAFGGAFMLAFLFPRARWVGYALAAGCGLTRILAGAHFVSDVVMGAVLGWVVAYLLASRSS
jgi:membrane-associated phospholipid phosphatase